MYSAPPHLERKSSAQDIAALEAQYVTTGDSIATEAGFLRGHGTLVRDGQLVSTVCGFVERVNKLVSVRPLQARYQPEIGDVLVGRITDVGDKLWRVDVNSRQNAMLMLSAVNLPGGVQRRRTHEDSLHMRSHFAESDLISAEVQNIQGDGSVHLHTRSLKYGKLENGMFLSVPAALIKRTKQHFHSLSIGIDLILGNNGYIWISATPPESEVDKALAAEGSVRTNSTILDTSVEAQEARNRAAKLQSIGAAMREKIARVRNSIVALSRMYISIFVPTIMDVYEDSLQLGLHAKDILDPANLHSVTQTAQTRQASLNDR